jgi:hypothetical protein
MGCDELYLLKKKKGSMLDVVYTKRDNLFMIDLANQCAD